MCIPFWITRGRGPAFPEQLYEKKKKSGKKQKREKGALAGPASCIGTLRSSEVGPSSLPHSSEVCHLPILGHLSSYAAPERVHVSC